MKIGKLQKELLRCLKENGCWKIDNYNSWNWDTFSNTKRILESLRKKGLVDFKEKTFTSNKSGLNILKGEINDSK